MAAALIASWVPDLTSSEAAALPSRRSAALRHGAAAAAAVATATLLFSVYPEGFGDRVDATRATLDLVPWLVALPWLKHLDLRPVVWFFLSLFFGFIAMPVLMWKVAYRALSLPYRDWKIEYWHAARCRAIRGLGAVILVDATHAQSTVPGRHEALWRRTLSWAWALVLAGFVMLSGAEIISAGGGAPDWAQGMWLGAAIIVGIGHLAGEFVLGLLNRRASKRSSVDTRAE